MARVAPCPSGPYVKRECVMRDIWRMWQVGLAAAALGAMLFGTGCATSELGGGEVETCRSNDDCAGELVCNRQTGACISIGGGEDGGGVEPEDTGGVTEPDAGGPIEEDAGGGGVPDVRVDPPDMGPDVPIDPDACTPGCGFNESCVNGSCVLDNVPCSPACEAPGYCDNGACEYPSCAAEGDVCDGNVPDQGAYNCLTDLEEQRSRCFSKCDNLYEASNCNPGKYCLDPVSNNPNIKVCVDSSCSVDSDCASGGQTGTCVEFSNGFGTCYPDGPVGVGAACSGANGCVNGAVCQTTGGTSGRCRTTCDPWASRSDCGGGDRCVIFSPRTGVCAPVADVTGTESGDTCSVPGQYCADGVRCFSTSLSNQCYQYCRPDLAGRGDCPGSTSICHEYLFPGQRDLGICQPECMNDQFCGGGSRCVTGRCRSVCQTGDPVVDCCGGTTPCDWTCGASGLCE